MSAIIPNENILENIYYIRGLKVMLDKDLALLYGVKTKRLNEQVRRNIKRFLKDFMFELTKDEFKNSRSQFATLKTGRGHHSKYFPMAFTEHGIAMLSSVLNSEKAIQVNIQIMRIFIKFRQWILSNEDLKRKIAEMEKKYDAQFKIVFEAIRQLIEPEIKVKPKNRIGF